MARRNTHYYLVKIARLSGWLLLPLMVLYILTGFALCGMLGFDDLIDYQQALWIHRIFDWPLVAAFLVHSSITTYFALRRWGWIKNRDCR
ncbi:MAG: hypothetical protein ABR915_18595 [Thermoguttaceae bacterium]|jgi:succinate dehydrogenase/fumarate reductase cytochrome b subunit